MSARDRDLFSSLYMFSWGSFVPLNPISVNTLVRKFSPCLLRADLDNILGSSVMLYLLSNIHSCFIHPYISSIPYILKVSIKMV